MTRNDARRRAKHLAIRRASPDERTIEVPNHVSPMPATFADETERHYWHTAQDIAFRAGLSLVEREGASWLVSEEGERLVHEPSKRLWFETCKVLHAEFPKLSRVWVGGRPLPPPRNTLPAP